MQDRYKKDMNQDFKTAYLRLQEINAYLKDNQIIDITELVGLQNEAKLLYEFLQKYLFVETQHDAPVFESDPS